jgi:hypothetical protein
MIFDNFGLGLPVSHYRSLLNEFFAFYNQDISASIIHSLSENIRQDFRENCYMMDINMFKEKYSLLLQMTSHDLEGW